MLTKSQIIQSRNDLPFLNNLIHIDNAATSPVPISVQAACNRYTDLTVHRLREVTPVSTIEFDRGRELIAQLVGSVADRIAYVQNTSHGLSLISMGLQWMAGDNLVVLDQEFPSNFLCWLQMEMFGVEVRRVPARNGRIDADDLASSIDGRTRVVALSHVQFYSGFRVNLSSIAEITHRHDALLVVDGTQSVGAMTIDVAGSGIDVLVVSGHKWMCAPRGIGFMALSERAMARVTPRIVGWLTVADPFSFNRTLDYLPSARRFEAGTPNGAGIYGLTERVAQILALDPCRIESQVLYLSQYVKELACHDGVELLFDFKDQEQSGITLLRTPGLPSVRLLELLERENIHASLRNDAIRLSPHYYTTADEIEQVVCTIREIRAAEA